MSENTNSKTCQCCGDTQEIKLTDREKCLINLAYYFAIRDTSSIKQYVIAAKGYGITNEEIKEVCSIAAENSKTSILSIIETSTKVKTSCCCI